jgi:hypothetical protein
MTGWIEARLIALELLANRFAGDIARLWQQLRAVQQGLISAQQQGSYGQGGTGSGFFVCMAPSSGTYAGTWTGSAPTGGASFTATVYQVANTGAVNSLGTQTVVNWMPATIANGKACVLIPDQAGNYGVVSQSCT